MTVQKAIYTVIGSDTYLGAHMLKHLKDKELAVIGIAQDEPFQYNTGTPDIAEENDVSENLPSVNAEWIVICLDPDMGFEKYVAKLRSLFAELTENEFVGNVCYFSCASICVADAESAIPEEPRIYPRNDRDLALAAGENMISVFSCSENGYGIPHIIRLGVPYGNELGTSGNNSSFVEHFLIEANKNKSLKIPLMTDVKRSLTHIADICEASIHLMETEDCPSQINIPGEVKTIREIAMEISAKYHAAFDERGLVRPGDPVYFLGDQHLSAELFNETVSFTPRYTFSKWLAEQ